MMNRERPTAFWLGIFDQTENRKAVRAGCSLTFFSNDFGDGRKGIGEFDGGVDHVASSCFPRPANQEWHAMTAFKNISVGPAPIGVALVIKLPVLLAALGFWGFPAIV